MTGLLLRFRDRSQFLEHPYPARIDFVAGMLMKGKRSMSPSPNAFIRKITSARFARWISGCVKRGRSRKSFSE